MLGNSDQTQHSVLFVDDDEVIRFVAEMSLKNSGYQVTLADDRFHALSISKSSRFDVVITDLHMPDNDDGFHLIEDLRKTTNYRHTPVIIQSTENSQKRRDLAKSLNVNAWITKPFRPRELVLSIEKVLGIQDDSTVPSIDKSNQHIGPDADIPNVICNNEYKALSRLQTEILKKIDYSTKDRKWVEKQLEFFDLLAVRSRLEKVSQRHKTCSFPLCDTKKGLDEIMKTLTSDDQHIDFKKLSQMIDSYSA
jgi:two-component system, chemotaxis family, chemotaxis protein CheY